jgi:TP53 regulating kinase-like protein
MERIKLISKGAEADLLLDPEWNGKKIVIKKRIKKGYRHQDLDTSIRRFRTIHEADIIHRAKQAGVPTPIIYQVDLFEVALYMQYIDGEKVKDIVDHMEVKERKEIFRTIGCLAGRLHKAGIIHGDLTTSNMIKSGKNIVFIDFGLGEISSEAEKRGVDLHLMKRMLTSTHYEYANFLFQSFEEGYTCIMGTEAMETLRRMREIEVRGRYIYKENRLDGDR